LLAASGIASASAMSVFARHVATVEGAKNGLFYVGIHGQQVNPWGNGTSHRCVVGPSCARPS